MWKRLNHRGVTLVEMMAVLIIIGILGGVISVNVVERLRSLTKLEYDNYAKEIFIAAQNHLTMAKSQGYLGRTDQAGEAQTLVQNEKPTTVNYFVVHSGDKFSNDTTILSLMLPFASIDETIRSGGSYIIRYEKDTAQVIDVFYWSERESDRFKLAYAGETADQFLNSINTLMEYGESRAVIGYYGGAELTYGEVLEAPVIIVTNDDTLTVSVYDPNRASDYSLKLIVTGMTSGAKKEIDLKNDSYAYIKRFTDGRYIVTLDDIRTPNQHFRDNFNAGQNGKNFSPGEDITIQAVAFNNNALTNVAYSATEKTNSLFADATDVGNQKAVIQNFRHLENLSGDVSGVNCGIGTNVVQISSARQVRDLSWRDFIAGHSGVYYTATSATNGTYWPVTPATGFTYDYDGEGHSIFDVEVTGAGNAGLFGTLTGGGVKNLKLIDFKATGGNTNAGALAGSVSGGTIANVIAYNSGSDATVTVSGSGAVGGLVGNMSGNAKMERCAAALVVESTADAGGLVGVASDTTKIIASYSGGHTIDGAYSTSAYNVTSSGGNAGGLIGNFSGAEVSYSYSTCSASGATAGGLIGSTGSGTITGCYATGKVNGTPSGAFLGSGGATIGGGNSYFYIINEKEVSWVESGVEAFDKDVATYNAFVEDGHNEAVPYDSKLILFYYDNGVKYTLKTVEQLGGSVNAGDFVLKHYGDWPAPETWVIN